LENKKVTAGKILNTWIGSVLKVKLGSG